MASQKRARNRLVAAGAYKGDGNRDLHFGGKNLTVKSIDGASKTVIDCQGSSASPHRGFYVNQGETTVAMDGFTVENGYATDNGGGFHVTSDNATTLTHCTAKNNTAAIADGGFDIISNATPPTMNHCTDKGNKSPPAGK